MFHERNGWRVVWREAGRRHSKTFPDKATAQRFEMERKLGIIAKADLVESPTFREWCDEWHRIYCRVEKAESQWRADEIVIRVHLVPALGDVRLRHLRRSHLTGLRDKLLAKTAHGKKHQLSPKTVNLALALARKILATAVERELIPSNPFAGVKLMRLPPPRFRYWTVGDREKFLAHADRVDPEFSRLVRVACHTGLRLGELGALTWADVDFDRAKIRVSKTFDVNLAKVIPMTKGRADDDVPMNPEVLRALGPARGQGTAPVFSRSLFWSARRRLGRLAEGAGVPAIRFHDLRHTFASTLAMAGVDLMLIKDLCRHKSYQMTLRYAHLHPDHRRGATDVLCVPQVTRIDSRRGKSGGPTGT